MNYKNFSLVLLFFFTLHISNAQNQAFQISDENPVKVSITGSSTLHDWKVEAANTSEFPQELSIELKEGAAIEGFSFKVEVKSMDGGRGSSMNDKIFNALRAETHPHVVFTQKEAAILSKNSEGGFSLVAIGNLMMAGVSNNVEVTVNLSEKDGKLTLSGSKALKMSDYKMEAPSAMFGQIQTKDDVEVHFEFNYNVK